MIDKAREYSENLNIERGHKLLSNVFKQISNQKPTRGRPPPAILR